MKEHFLLGEVAKVLGRKPHQLVHALVSGHVSEPENRIANKRLFGTGDVTARQAFQSDAELDAIEPAPAGAVAEGPERLTLRPPFEVVQVGESGHEIRDGEGEVFAWAGDRGHALVVAGLLDAAARG